LDCPFGIRRPSSRGKHKRVVAHFRVWDRGEPEGGTGHLSPLCIYPITYGLDRNRNTVVFVKIVLNLSRGLSIGSPGEDKTDDALWESLLVPNRPPCEFPHAFGTMVHLFTLESISPDPCLDDMGGLFTIRAPHRPQHFYDGGIIYGYR